MKPIYAWHFVGETLRDGSKIPKDGVPLSYPGPLALCKSGLHASRLPFHALMYAPGNTLCYVKCEGKIVEGHDKLVCYQRTIVARMDGTEMLYYFARMQALAVVHLWDAPDVVLDYLMTGTQRDAAFNAARVYNPRWASNAFNDACAAYAAANAARAAADGFRPVAIFYRGDDEARNAARAARNAARAASNAFNAACDARDARDACANFNALVLECFEGVL